jgi:hypothetical protein
LLLLRGELVLNKWAIFCAAAAVIAVGCAGGGHSGGSSGGSGGGGNQVSTVNDAELLKPGVIDVTFLTGQGRAPGSPTAVINRVFFQDQYNTNPFDQEFNVETRLQEARYLGLDQYTVQTIPVDVPFPWNVTSRLFQTYTLEVAKLRVENGSGGFDEYTGTGGNPLVYEQFPCYVRAFRGRHSTLPVFLDDAMLYFDGFGVQFDRNLFEIINFDPNDNRINGFISDYVEFDISAMAPADRPQLSGGADAEKAFFSGDGQAIGAAGAFEVLIPSGFIEGTYTLTDPITNVASYTLVQLDPRDLTNTAKITSLLGIWRPYTKVLSNVSSFEFIMFPNTRDDNFQDLVIIQRNGGGQITTMYYGLADYSVGTFQAWPIRNIDDGSVANEITGTLSSYLAGGGNPTNDYTQIRYGQFAFDASPDLPASFPTTGRFLVFRR